ncbi:MAG: hypothetical protein ACRELC_11740, partial [Gemmatimonadota bacterium]
MIPSEVHDLIERSREIQGWIVRLKEHEGETRRAVYEKVFADYRERLAGVTAKLATHREGLVSTLEGRRAEVASLRSEREEHAARLEEAKLRHVVGEYDDDEWEERRDEIEANLEGLDGRLSDEGETVEALEEIIGAIPAEGEPAEPGAGAAAAATARAPG